MYLRRRYIDVFFAEIFLIGQLVMFGKLFRDKKEY